MIFYKHRKQFFINYADDTTPHVICSNPEEVLLELKGTNKKLFTWFSQNGMKVNLDECYMLLSTTNLLNFQISDTVIHYLQSKKLLGVTFDNYSRVQKANRKLNDLARIALYIELAKGRILMKAFFDSHFNYYPIVWMFHSHNLNNKINRLHEGCLRIIYNDKTTSVVQVLEKDNSVSIYHKNIRALAIEMYTVANGIPLEIMHELFQLRDESHYNLRYTSQFTIPAIPSIYNGRETLSYIGHKICSYYSTVLSEYGKYFLSFPYFGTYQIIAKYEKRRTYLSILHEATCDNR